MTWKPVPFCNLGTLPPKDQKGNPKPSIFSSFLVEFTGVTMVNKMISVSSVQSVIHRVYISCLILNSVGPVGGYPV